MWSWSRASGASWRKRRRTCCRNRRAGAAPLGPPARACPTATRFAWSGFGPAAAPRLFFHSAERARIFFGDPGHSPLLPWVIGSRFRGWVPRGSRCPRSLHGFHRAFPPAGSSPVRTAAPGCTPRRDATVEPRRFPACTQSASPVSNGKSRQNAKLFDRRGSPSYLGGEGRERPVRRRPRLCREAQEPQEGRGSLRRSSRPSAIETPKGGGRQAVRRRPDPSPGEEVPSKGGAVAAGDPPLEGAKAQGRHGPTPALVAGAATDFRGGQSPEGGRGPGAYGTRGRSSRRQAG